MKFVDIRQIIKAQVHNRIEKGGINVRNGISVDYGLVCSQRMIKKDEC